MNSGRVVLAIAAGIGMLATFLPWLHAPILGTVYGVKGDGWITFLLFAVSLVAAVASKRSQPPSLVARIAVAVPAAGAAVFGAWKLMQLNDKLAFMQSNPVAKVMSQAVSVGVGHYLVLGMGVLVPVLAFVVGRASPPPQALD